MTDDDQTTTTGADDPGSGDSVDGLIPDSAGGSDAVGTDDRTVRSDGGTVDSPFETTSTVQETRADRIDRVLEEYVRTPLGIVAGDWRAVVGSAILSVYVLMGTIGVMLIEPTHPAQGPQLLGPFQNVEFLLGTTQTGKDLLAMTVHATPSMLIMMLSGAVFTVVVGTVFGVVAGYKGGMTDTVLSTITDVFINLPGLPLTIVLATLLADWIESPVTLGILLAVAAWAGLARAIRSQVLTIRGESFVESARAMDLSTVWILRKEILPHLMPYIAVNMVNAARRIIFGAVALYFLGVLPFADANWGVMLNNAYESGAIYRGSARHWLFVPMAAISGIAVGLILLAQSLDRVFNPRARARHQSPDASDRPEADGEDDTKDIMQV